jgi:putative toxin-antitoxin system antitoxin component (TIGR02293 family)
MAVVRKAAGRVPPVIRTLGGPELVHARSLGELRERLRAGLPYASLAAVASGFGLGGEDATTVLRIPPRTLARRKRERRLSPEESDRLFRLGRIATLAEDVLGDRRRAAQWLRVENRALGNATPLSCLDTDLGAEEVEAVLLRLAHGVFG